MQVTKNSLREKDSEFFGWFLKNFGNNRVDAYVVIEKLREQKTAKSWMFWLFRKYELSGLHEMFNPDGSLRELGIFKDGKLDGLYESFYRNGTRMTLCIYKNDKLALVAEYHLDLTQWNEKGEKIS